MKWLTNLAILLALCTITLGAFTRLTEAGLGCPDWPGCYGAMVAPVKSDQLANAQKHFPNAHIEPHKARNEMLHRYIAGCLGLSVLGIFVLSLRKKQARVFSALIILLVLAQALMGMLTVTLSLLPLIVLGHLLGGFVLLSSLVVLRLYLEDFSGISSSVSSDSSLRRPRVWSDFFPLKIFGWLALAILLIQISLGAWTSANYAALACHQLPICEPGWSQRFDIGAAFRLPMDEKTYQYGVLSQNARMSIHVLHRFGALVTFLTLSSFAFVCWRYSTARFIKIAALLLASLLVVQVCLGLINVIAFLPLANAVAHNLVAASLLMMLSVVIFRLYRPAC